MAVPHARLAGKARFFAVLGEQIEKCERQILLIVAETAGDAVDDFLLGNRLGQFSCERAQRFEPAFSDDPVGFFRYDTKMAGDRAVVPGQRTVRKGVVSLLTISAAFQEQQQRFIPGCLASVEHSLNARADVAPNLAPHFARRLSQCPRMLLPEGHPRIVVVVEKSKFGSPAHPHGEA